MGRSELEDHDREPVKVEMISSKFPLEESTDGRDLLPAAFVPHRVARPPGRDEHRFGTDGNSSPTSLAKDYRHKQVPKTMNLEVEYKYSAQGPPTTLMIRNIPNRYTQNELIQELEELGFGGTFDFFYMPMDQGRHRHHGVRKTASNVGYAFVNFIEHLDAALCMETMKEYVFKQHGNKVAMISIAHIQGLDANLAHYEKAAVNGVNSVNGPVVMPNLAAAFTKRRSAISEVDLEGYAPADVGLWATDWNWAWPIVPEMWAPGVDNWMATPGIWPLDASGSPWSHAMLPGSVGPCTSPRKAGATGKRAAGRRTAGIGGA